MKMNKGALIMALLMAAHVCNAAVLPSGSRFDPRNQIVSYNPNNTTIINSAVGYTTTLVFDEDETVISARTGFPQGWAVNKEDNLVYLEVRPVKQTVQKNNTDANGNTSSESVSVALDPENELERWRTNLFVRTTKRNYSMELNARTFRQPEKIAFVVNYQYPQERRKEQAEIEKKRTELLPDAWRNRQSTVPWKMRNRPVTGSTGSGLLKAARISALIMHMTMAVIPGSASVR